MTMESYKSQQNVFALITMNPNLEGVCRDATTFKKMLLRSLAHHFGANYQVPLDILKYDNDTKEVLIRCDEMVYQRLATVNEVPVNNHTSSSMSLKFNNRNYTHHKKPYSRP